MKDLEDLISTLTDHEKSGSLVYALFERDDNTILIQQLAAQTDKIEPDHMSKLVTLGAQSALDDGNVDVLFGSSTPVGDATKGLLGMVMA